MDFRFGLSLYINIIFKFKNNNNNEQMLRAYFQKDFRFFLISYGQKKLPLKFTYIFLKGKW